MDNEKTVEQLKFNQLRLAAAQPGKLGPALDAVLTHCLQVYAAKNQLRVEDCALSYRPGFISITAVNENATHEKIRTEQVSWATFGL